MEPTLSIACAGTKGLMVDPASGTRYILCMCGVCDAAKKYTPPEFEAHCGRSAARSWKTTLRVVAPDGTTSEKLKDWLERQPRPQTEGAAAEDDDASSERTITEAAAAAATPAAAPDAAGPSSQQALPKKKRGRPPKHAAAPTAAAASSDQLLAKKQRAVPLHAAATAAPPPPPTHQQKWVPAKLFVAGEERPRANPSPIPHVGDILLTQHAKTVMDKRAAAFEGLQDGVYSPQPHPLPPQPVCEPDELPSIYERVRVVFEKDSCSPMYTSLVGRKLQDAGVLQYPARKLVASRDLPKGAIACVYFGNVHTGTSCYSFLIPRIIPPTAGSMMNLVFPISRTHAGRDDAEAVLADVPSSFKRGLQAMYEFDWGGPEWGLTINGDPSMAVACMANSNMRWDPKDIACSAGQACNCASYQVDLAANLATEEAVIKCGSLLLPVLLFRAARDMHVNEECLVAYGDAFFERLLLNIVDYEYVHGLQQENEALKKRIAELEQQQPAT